MKVINQDIWRLREVRIVVIDCYKCDEVSIDAGSKKRIRLLCT